jgi:diamine N-acetyltransferase
VPFVKLLPVTSDNWLQCIELSLSPDQQDFVASNLYSIAEAQFYPSITLRAVATREEHIVGFVVYGLSPTSQQYKIVRLMVDHRHQGQGYGRAAMEAVIADILATTDANEVWLSYRSWNTAARRLYLSLGFREQDEEPNGRIVASLHLVPYRKV